MPGKHRAPSKIKPRIIKTGIVTLAATSPVVFTPNIAQAASVDSILAAIASCESGNRNILTGIVDRNGRRLSSAGGYWQIVNGTWRAHGGTKFAPTAVQASYQEQLTVARRILTQGQGIGAWAQSKSCWAKRVGKVPAVAPTPKKALTVKPREKIAQRVAASYVIKRGDTLSRIARRHGTSISRLANLNHIKNVNRIYAGASLRLR